MTDAVDVGISLKVTEALAGSVMVMTVSSWALWGARREARDAARDDVWLGLHALHDGVQLPEALLHLVVEVLDELGEVGEFREDLPAPVVEIVGRLIVLVDRQQRLGGLLGPVGLELAGFFQVTGGADALGLEVQAALESEADGLHGLVFRGTQFRRTARSCKSFGRHGNLRCFDARDACVSAAIASEARHTARTHETTIKLPASTWQIGELAWEF